MKLLFMTILFCIVFLFYFNTKALLYMIKYAFKQIKNTAISKVEVIYLAMKIKYFRHAVIIFIVELIGIILLLLLIFK